MKGSTLPRRNCYPWEQKCPGGECIAKDLKCWPGGSLSSGVRPTRGSLDRRIIGSPRSGRAGCTTDADCPGDNCFCRNGVCTTTDPLGCMPGGLAARQASRSKPRATIPRAGCTYEQIKAGCMWRSDIGRCQCPSPQELTLRPFQPKGAESTHGSLTIFPKTLQTQTVTRRYPKRKP